MRLRAYGLIALAGAIWGSMGVMAKMLYASGVSPWSIIFFRASLGLLVCGLVLLLVERSGFLVRKRDVPFLAVYALVGTSAFFVLYLFSISLSAVAVAVVLLYTAPPMAAVLARFVFGEALSAPKVAALVLSFVGCALVAGLMSGPTVTSPLGIAVGLGSALTYALFSIMSKYARGRYGPVTLQFYALGFGTLFLTPILAMPEMSLGPYPEHVWLLLGAIAVGPTVLARVLYLAALKHVEASRAAIVATVEPVAASLFAFLILGEVLSPIQLLGGALVLAGAMLARVGGRVREPSCSSCLRGSVPGTSFSPDCARQEPAARYRDS